MGTLNQEDASVQGELQTMFMVTFFHFTTATNLLRMIHMIMLHNDWFVVEMMVDVSMLWLCCSPYRTSSLVTKTEVHLLALMLSASGTSHGNSQCPSRSMTSTSVDRQEQLSPLPRKSTSSYRPPNSPMLAIKSWKRIW